MGPTPILKRRTNWSGLLKGGKIIALSQCIGSILQTQILFALKKKEDPTQDTTSQFPYSELERNEISEITTGSDF